jgi:hypothetical protein
MRRLTDVSITTGRFDALGTVLGGATMWLRLANGFQACRICTARKAAVLETMIFRLRAVIMKQK